MSAFELIDILNSLLNNLKNRKDEHFTNTEIETLIDIIEEKGYLVKKIIQYKLSKVLRFMYNIYSEVDIA